jgi:hypothetical protein
MSNASSKERHGFGTTVLLRQVLRQPIADIALQPADAAAVETLFSRKLTKHGHAEQPPSRPTSKPRDIVSAQKMLPAGKRSFTHRERVTFLREAPEGAHSSGEEFSGLINDLHVWFRSFRVKLSRMAPSCANLASQFQPCLA